MVTIRKLSHTYKVISTKTGRNLGEYTTRREAEARIRKMKAQGKKLAKRGKRRRRRK